MGGEARLFAIFLTSATRRENSWHPDSSWELVGGREGEKDYFTACMHSASPLPLKNNPACLCSPPPFTLQSSKVSWVIY